MVAKYIYLSAHLISYPVTYILTYDSIYVEVSPAFSRGPVTSMNAFHSGRTFSLFLVLPSANNATVNLLHTSLYSNILHLHLGGVQQQC